MSSELPKKKVYVETSVWGYLTARPSVDPTRLGMQTVTQEWWSIAKQKFELYSSPVVDREAVRGDECAAGKRLAAIRENSVSLPVTQACETLAERLLETTAVPRTSFDDALHIATAAVSGMDYLVTWNCKHIARPETMPLIRATCESMGYRCPGIFTPYVMRGGSL